MVRTIYIVGLSTPQLEQLDAAGYAVMLINEVQAVPLTVTRNVGAHLAEIAALLESEYEGVA